MIGCVGAATKRCSNSARARITSCVSSSFEICLSSPIDLMLRLSQIPKSVVLRFVLNATRSDRIVFSKFFLRIASLASAL